MTVTMTMEEYLALKQKADTLTENRQLLYTMIKNGIGIKGAIDLMEIMDNLFDDLVDPYHA